MAITTFSELKTGIANWLERDDLTSRIPEFIALAEARHRREIRIRQMQKRQNLLSGTSYTITGITQANPGVVTTSAAHGYENGDIVYIQGVVGMVEVNNRSFTVANKTSTTFEIEDCSGHTAYSSGGETIKEGVDSRYSILPDDFLGERGIYITASRRRPLDHISPVEMDRESETATGRPETYTINGDELEFNKAPDQTYTGVMRYFAEVEPLSDGNTTNIILSLYPDLYLYGALIASAPFLYNDERIGVWNGLYQIAKDDANKSARKQMTGGSRRTTVIGRGP